MRLVLLALAACPLAAQSNWLKAFPPHKVAGNVYYVGTEGLATFLIATPEGHFLINSDFESTVPIVRGNIEKLGFQFADIKIILGSHAHSDHMEADALVKELSGGRVMVMAEDAPMLRTIRPGRKPHPVDRELKDQEHITLGGTTLVAHRTPGHTKGCTTWTLQVEEDGAKHNVVIVCSLGVNPGYVLVNNREYPEIVEDYERSFALVRDLPCDVFLGAHGSVYGLAGKFPKIGGKVNPFIDRRGLKIYVDIMERSFRAELARQRK